MVWMTFSFIAIIIIAIVLHLIVSDYLSHTLYYRTISILRGRAKLPPVFNELKAFIQSKYDVTAYNFLFRKEKNFIKALLRAKNAENILFVLEVQLASAFDYDKIMEQESKDMNQEVIAKEVFWILRNYNKDIQEAIAEKFLELANKYNYAKIESRRSIRVCYYDFSDKMKTLIYRKTVKNAGKLIMRKYASHNLWLVRNLVGSPVVFFLSNEDLENNSGVRAEIEDDYFGLLKQRDEFNVFDRASFRLKFDSKQNFMENFKGDWYIYIDAPIRGNVR